MGVEIGIKNMPCFVNGMADNAEVFLRPSCQGSDKRPCNIEPDDAVVRAGCGAACRVTEEVKGEPALQGKFTQGYVEDAF